MENNIKQLKENGIVIIEDFIDVNTCDLIIRDFYDFVSTCPPDQLIRTENGNLSRLYNLHLFSENVRNILFSDKLMSLLDLYFKKKTALNSTIYFEEGSSQCIHRDTPYFWSEPNGGEFVGVWFAFENTNINNGKLQYYPFGHKIDVDRLEFSKKYNELSAGELFGQLSDDIEELCINKGLKLESPDIKKGSIIIWHADLPHGGSTILDKKSTRHSLVAHYLPENSYITTIDYYFERESYRRIMDFTEGSNNRKMRNVNSVAFAGNTVCNKNIN